MKEEERLLLQGLRALLVTTLDLSPHFELITTRQWCEGSIQCTNVFIQYLPALSAALTLEHTQEIEEYLSRVSNEDIQITIEFQSYMDGDEVRHKPCVIKVRKRKR